MASQQFCTFYVAHQLYGVELDQVQEIVGDEASTRVPLAPPAIAGLINLRGQVVPIIDLRRCLSLPASEAPPANVVLTTDSGAVSLRVDQIGDVLSVSEEAFEPTPDNMSGPKRKLVRGVYKLDSGLLLVLSAPAAIEMAVSTGPSSTEPVAGVGICA